MADQKQQQHLQSTQPKMNGRQQRNQHEISPNGNGNGCQDETNSSQSTVLTEYRHHEQVYQQASLFHPNSSQADNPEDHHRSYFRSIEAAQQDFH